MKAVASLGISAEQPCEPLADIVAVRRQTTIPARMCLGTWVCQDMLTVDIAPGQGSRNQNGELYASEMPGLEIVPDPHKLGEPVAVYS